jgi:hypothetical protein
MYVYTTYCVVAGGENAKAAMENKENEELRTEEEREVKKRRNYRVRPQLTHPMIYVSGYSALQQW